MSAITHDFANWMQTLPEVVQKRRINHIAIPGTHDSQSYTIDFQNPLGPGLVFSLANLAARVSTTVATIIEAWTLTQSASVYDQLTQGCRSFDFRVSYDHSSDTFYFTHTFTCIPLETALNDLKLFLETHPGEVVIIQMKPGYFDRHSMPPSHNDLAVQKVEDTLGPLLCPCTPKCRFDETMSLENMVKRNERAILYYQGDLAEQYSFVWDDTHLNDPWDDTSNLEQKLDELSADLEGFEVSEENLNMISFTLTPQQKEVIQDIFSRFLKRGYKGEGVFSLAKEMHAAIPEFWKQHHVEIKKATIFKTNFPTPEFVKYIISANSPATLAEHQNFSKDDMPNSAKED